MRDTRDLKSLGRNPVRVGFPPPAPLIHVGPPRGIMRKINIAFLYFDDKICSRCAMSEDNLNEAINQFKRTHRDFEIVVKKQKLPRRKIEESPTILLDGTDLESYIPSASKPKSDHCDDCSCLLDSSVSCRTYGNDKAVSKSQILMALEKYIKR